MVRDILIVFAIIVAAWFAIQLVFGTISHFWDNWRITRRYLRREKERIYKKEKDDKQRKEARDLAKETYKKARSSKDDKEYSHPTEHDESDDLEMVKAIKEKE